MWFQSTITVKILQNIFAAKVGVTITMVVCRKNVSVVKIGALLNNTGTCRKALKAKAFYGDGRKDCRLTLTKIYVVCVVLNDESGWFSG